MSKLISPPASNILLLLPDMMVSTSDYPSDIDIVIFIVSLIETSATNIVYLYVCMQEYIAYVQTAEPHIIVKSCYMDTPENYFKSILSEHRGANFYMFSNCNLPVIMLFDKYIPGIIYVESPKFCTEITNDYTSYPSPYNFEEFYIHTRKQLKYLVHPNGNPMGGDWMLRCKKSNKIEQFMEFESRFMADAIKFLNSRIPNHKILPQHNLPFNHEQWIQWFSYLINKLMAGESVAQYWPIISIGLNNGSVKYTDFIKILKVAFNGQNAAEIEILYRKLIQRETMRLIYETDYPNLVPKTTLLPDITIKLPSGIYEVYTELALNGYISERKWKFLRNFFLIMNINLFQIREMFVKASIDRSDWLVSYLLFADNSVIYSDHFATKIVPRGTWTTIWRALLFYFNHKYSNDPVIQQKWESLNEYDKNRMIEIANMWRISY